MVEPRLYGYYRSSAAYRVRIALNLKGLHVAHVPVHLRKGEQQSAAYLAKNPQGLVPWFEDEHVALGQSLAIIEYLEEAHPTPALFPPDLALRAYTRELAYIIACDIHPLGNLRVLKKLHADYGMDTEGAASWNRHWIALGLAAFEAKIARTAGRFAVGDTPGLADICLVPQLYNARRYGLDLTSYPRLSAIEAACHALPAFADAAPENQPDFEEG